MAKNKDKKDKKKDIEMNPVRVKVYVKGTKKWYDVGEEDKEDVFNVDTLGAFEILELKHPNKKDKSVNTKIKTLLTSHGSNPGNVFVIRGNEDLVITSDGKSYLSQKFKGHSHALVELTEFEEDFLE